MTNILDQFNGDINVVVVGASGGIGKALLDILCEQENVKKIYAFSRSECTFVNHKIEYHKIDITNEQSIQNAARCCTIPINLMIVATGMLSDDRHLPEKSLKDIDYEAMQECFGINTFGPALLLKNFMALVPKDNRSVVAFLSARVGSISDNQIGGWYSYRASKAALNMVLKSAAIETARRYKKAVIIGLHPGTVDTALSKPFQNHVKHDIFSPAQAAGYLLRVINTVDPEDSGKCFAWDGKEIIP